MATLKIETYIKIYSADEIPSAFFSLIAAARCAAEKAYAPYSRFCVGAAVELANGDIIAANNQENEVYNLGCCAERVALFYASAQHSNITIKKILLLTTTPPHNEYLVTPCGACRQTLLEYEKKQGAPIEVLMMAANGALHQTESAAALLPLGFQL